MITSGDIQTEFETISHNLLLYYKYFKICILIDWKGNYAV